jgi:hypothetical protein
MVMTRRVLVTAVAIAALAAGASALGFDQQAPVLVAGISWA